MKAFKVFVFGLLYGWFLKFAINRIYRDHEIENIRKENLSLREHIRSLDTKLQSKPMDTGSVTRTAAQGKPVRTGKDNLKAIKGIGPAIEKKLNAAGIATFEALARLTVEELENILGSTKRLVKDPGSLLAQAKILAQ